MKNRIIRTFSIYIVLIIIPIGVLLYQGFRSLSLHRQQLENNVITQLDQARTQFRRELYDQWRQFLETERVRDYSHYRPLILPDEARFYAPESGAFQRSPLQLKPNNFQVLLKGSPPAAANQEGQPFQDSLVGYFEFDPRDQAFSTPYDTTKWFPVPSETAKTLERYRLFLQSVIKPSLRDELNIASGTDFSPRSLLLHLKTRRITKDQEPNKKVIQLARLNDESSTSLSSLQNGGDWVDVSYYDFKFETLNLSEGKYIYGFRPVIIDDEVRIQGFVFDILRLLQEIQSVLEPLQPEFGSLVISAFDAGQGTSLFDPLGALSIDFNLSEDEHYLQTYYAERQRLYLTTVFLVVALIASLTHIGRLLHAENQLAMKKNDFVSAVTHELKAPLTSIQLYAELLQEGWAKGKENTYYRYIHSETIRLARLVNNILDFARMESDELKLKPAPVKLTTFVKETVESWRFWLEENGFSIAFAFSGSPSVNLDRDSFAQVIYNLCDNALKYAKTASNPTLFFLIEETETDAILTIHDNGPGVSRDEEAKIFDRFYRGENELTRENTGTGLGLALVAEIIEKNNASWSVFHPSGHSGFGMRIRFPKILAASE